jgi:outer membrane protein
MDIIHERIDNITKNLKQGGFMKQQLNLKLSWMVFFVFILMMIGVTSICAEEGKTPWLIRMRIIGVLPDDDSTTISGIGGKATVDNSITGDLDFSYFFTENIATELTLALGQHNVEAKNTALGDVDLGDVWLLPPTLTLQYHILPNSMIRPYLGAGVNYTVLFAENKGVTVDDVDYDNAFGWALQAGCDIAINENFAINLDVKKIFLDTDVDVSALGQSLKTDVDIDPWLVGIGIAYRFSCP